MNLRWLARTRTGLVVAALVGASGCDRSVTLPSRVVEPGYVVSPPAGTSLERREWGVATVTVVSVHLVDARMSAAVVYRAPDGTDNLVLLPVGDGRDDLARGYVHLPYAMSVVFAVPEAPPSLPPGSRAVEARVYLDVPTPRTPAAPGLIATYPIVG